MNSLGSVLKVEPFMFSLAMDEVRVVHLGLRVLGCLAAGLSGFRVSGLRAVGLGFKVCGFRV